jgi:hypothetical protein
MFAQLENLFVRQGAEVFRTTAAVVDLPEELPHRDGILLPREQLADALAEAFRRPAEVCL